VPREAARCRACRGAYAHLDFDAVQDSRGQSRRLPLRAALAARHGTERESHGRPLGRRTELRGAVQKGERRKVARHAGITMACRRR